MTVRLGKEELKKTNINSYRTWRSEVLNTLPVFIPKQRPNSSNIVLLLDAL